MSRGARVVLTAVVQRPDGAMLAQITALTGYKETSRRTYLQQLRSQGLVMVGEPVRATPEGVAMLGPGAERLPVGHALLDHWRGRLGAGEVAVLNAIVEARPGTASKAGLSEATKYKDTSLRTYLQKLKARHLVEEPERGQFRANGLFFESGRAA